MFSTLAAKDSRTNHNSEAWGDVGTVSTPTTTTIGGIPSGDARTALFKPLSGLLQQEKYVLLRYMPLTIELELVSPALEPIVSNVDWSVFPATNTSLLWQIENVQVKCD